MLTKSMIMDTPVTVDMRRVLYAGLRSVGRVLIVLAHCSL